MVAVAVVVVDVIVAVVALGKQSYYCCRILEHTIQVHEWYRQ